MDKEAFEIAVEKELEDVFGYNNPYIVYEQKVFAVAKKIPITEETEYNTIERKKFSIEKPLITSRVYFFLIIGSIFIVMLCLLYFISKTKLLVAIVRVFELVIATGGIGIGVVFLYNGLVFLYKKLTEKKRLLKTLKNLDMGIYKESVGKNLNEIKKILKNYSIQEASNLLAKEDIRKRVCPALKSATDDVFVISKAVTPVLVGCVVAGTISIPLNPVLFAAIAVVIARMGISALCAGFITK